MKIGLIGAMDEEIKYLKENMDDIQVDETAAFQFILGTLKGQEVILLKSGIGKVNAAIGTTILLEKYNPNYVINTGSAGGVHPDLRVGDLVISSRLRYHDVDVTAFGYEYGQVPQMPPTFAADKKLIAVAQKCAESIRQQAVKGTIASGDAFMNDAERMESIRSQIKDLYAVEMEGAAIAHVCHRFQTPFVVIRSLSDIAGKEAEMSFEQFLTVAAKNSAQLILLMVKELGNVG